MIPVELYTKREAIQTIRNNLDENDRPDLKLLPAGFSYQYYANTETYDFSYYNIFVARFRRGCHIY
jgi:hypothetical protein